MNWRNGPGSLKPHCWLLIMMIIYAALFSYFGIMRHLSSSLGDPDTSINDQSMYTALKYGMPLVNTFEKGSHFAVHTSPIFYLLLPLYALHPGTEIIVILESIALAMGALPLFLIARERFSEKTSLAIAALYLLYHPLHGVNYDQTNEMCFAVAPLLFALHYFLKRRFLPFWISMAIFLSVKEDTAFVAIFWGIYGLGLFFMEKRRSPLLAASSAAMIGLGMLYLYVALYIILPCYHRDHVVINFYNRYSHLGTTMHGVLWTIITRPLYILSFLAEKERVLYFLELFLPLAFVPLFSPGLLFMTIPSFAINLLSTSPQMYNTGGRYSAYIIPFIFCSALLALEKILARCGTPELREKTEKKVLMTMGILTILSTLLLNHTPLRIGFNVPRITAHQKKILSLVKTIPPEASVSTQVDILKHLCRRVHAYSGYHEECDYIVVDETSRWYITHAHWDKVLPEVLAEGDYEKIVDDEGIKIYRRKASKAP
jgi:uncharacterized membrane protein